MANVIILDGKYVAYTDDFHSVLIKGKNKGTIKSQNVEAVLLLELVGLQQKILDILERHEA